MSIRVFGLTMVLVNLIPVAMLFWLGTTVDAFTVAIINIVFLILISLSTPQTNNKMLILNLLSLKDGLTGQELVDASGGNLTRSSVYVHLSELKDKGLVRHVVTTGALGIDHHQFYLPATPNTETE